MLSDTFSTDTRHTTHDTHTSGNVVETNSMGYNSYLTTLIEFLHRSTARSVRLIWSAGESKRVQGALNVRSAL